MVIFQGVSFSCSPKEGNMVKRFIAKDVVSARRKTKVGVNLGFSGVILSGFPLWDFRLITHL